MGLFRPAFVSRGLFAAVVAGDSAIPKRLRLSDSQSLVVLAALSSQAVTSQVAGENVVKVTTTATVRMMRGPASSAFTVDGMATAFREDEARRKSTEAALTLAVPRIRPSSQPGAVSAAGRSTSTPSLASPAPKPRSSLRSPTGRVLNYADANNKEQRLCFYLGVMSRVGIAPRACGNADTRQAPFSSHWPCRPPAAGQTPAPAAARTRQRLAADGVPDRRFHRPQRSGRRQQRPVGLRASRSPISSTPRRSTSSTAPSAA